MKESNVNSDIENTCKVEKHNKTQNRIRFKNHIAPVGDDVIILTLEQYQELKDHSNNADKYLNEINQLKYEIDNTDIRALKQENEDLKKQVKNKDNSINTYKTNSVKSKARIEDLESRIEEYKKSIDNNDTEIEQYHEEINELKGTNKEQATIISDLKETNDILAKKLDESIDASEFKDLQKENSELLKQYNYYKDAHDSLIKYEDEIVADNENLKNENRKLQSSIDSINKTNRMLNENILGLKATFDETEQQLKSDFEKQEIEMKETIQKQKSNIDDLTNKYHSLLPLQDNIKQSTHYKEIDALKNKLNDTTNELNKTKAEIETKLAIQKSNLEVEFADEKAKLFVAYNSNIDDMKLQYNNLANEYNFLLDELDSITRLNALFEGRHKKIIKDKEKAELIEIHIADNETIDYIPKPQS